METLKEIREAIHDYNRMYFIQPNTIYVARETYEKFIEDIENQLVAVKAKTPYEHSEHTVYGLRIKVTRTIKDGFLVVNEFT